MAHYVRVCQDLVIELSEEGAGSSASSVAFMVKRIDLWGIGRSEWPTGFEIRGWIAPMESERLGRAGVWVVFGGD